MSLAHINTGGAPATDERAELRAVPDPAPAPGAVGSTLQALPGLLRISAVTVAHTAGWGIAAYARTWGRVARAVVDPGEAARLSDDLGAVAGQLTELARSVAKGGPISEAVERWGLPALEAAQTSLQSRGTRPGGESESDKLRRYGEQLLRRSRDVWDDDSRHPAYAAILRDLAPDEARLLVLLLRDGPQPSVDVREGGAIGRLTGARAVARGLTMIGPRASVRYPDSVPQYLNNLTRLGLVWQSPEPVAELLRYQVVEAQPDVLDAVHSVRSARIIRRSIHLTPFGQDFARVCFADADELADLPTHEAPPDAAATEGPDD
ncbi:Abi-alpha family protein [Nocardioides sp. DS6]|uniref:Abi-alpha family protein n=1 Tax=Nocardioides eburneus TaxID=3231482 RepID=A0ABV3T0J1_9ACTN